jgi:hypothetical protein
MNKSLENRIRERAYEIWTAHGCMHGQAEQHWLAAEQEMLATSTAMLADKPNPKTKPPRTPTHGYAATREAAMAAFAKSWRRE